MTNEPTFWYYDPEHRTAPVRQLPWGTADQCNMSAPFQTQEAAELSRQAARRASFSGLLDDLATEAREINTANGWGTGFNPDVNRDELPSYLALIHSEITEAWIGHMPPACFRELGDVIVRALDLGQLIQPGYWRDRTTDWHTFDLGERTPSNWEAELLTLHWQTSEALEHYRKDLDWRPGVLKRLHVLVATAWHVMRAYGTEPESIIREILAANRQRGYRHGGRRT